FDPGVGVYNITSVGGADIFIQKLDSNGNFIWVKSIGATNHEISRAITIDNLGNPIVTGYFEDTVDFDPGAGVFNLTSAGGDDVFLLKLDINGNFVWARAIGGTGLSRGESVS